MWITYKELTSEWGGKKEEHMKNNEYVKMPFNYCNLSMAPFKDPYCTEDGTIFDLLSIVPYIKKYKKNPVTGGPMKESDLIKLNFHKNE
jgi:peptidyl-prolyl cis-trans isomerase-like protein 2